MSETGMWVAFVIWCLFMLGQVIYLAASVIMEFREDGGQMLKSYTKKLIFGGRD